MDVLWKAQADPSPTAPGRKERLKATGPRKDGETQHTAARLEDTVFGPAVSGQNRLPLCYTKGMQTSSAGKAHLQNQVPCPGLKQTHLGPRQSLTIHCGPLPSLTFKAAGMGVSQAPQGGLVSGASPWRLSPALWARLVK